MGVKIICCDCSLDPSQLASTVKSSPPQDIFHHAIHEGENDRYFIMNACLTLQISGTRNEAAYLGIGGVAGWSLRCYSPFSHQASYCLQLHHSGRQFPLESQLDQTLNSEVMRQL